MSISTSEKSDGSGQSALLVHPDVHEKGANFQRSLDYILLELKGLARAISLDVAGVEVLKIGRIQASRFFGKGQVERLASIAEELKPSVVIVNRSLTPVQQRNLEKEINCKVIDRTGLILEIFGARAQTREGRLQVELAALEYQKSRLVRSWTHLERQRGGAGFMGGPGERQIELDRRIISEKIKSIKKDLIEVRRTRDLARKSRERVPFPVVALVGYTNAGKSTLFNRLSRANVFAEDLPFATLDPTMRKIELGNGQPVILSDTVGFISDLPVHLVESFKATLEHIAHADVILHVIDSASGDSRSQKGDVIAILQDLGIEYESDGRIIEVMNKIDAVAPDDRFELKGLASPSIRSVAVSALTGEGVEELLKAAEQLVSSGRIAVTVRLGMTEGQALSWIYRNAEIVSRADNEDGVMLDIMIDQVMLDQFRSKFGRHDEQAG